MTLEQRDAASVVTPGQAGVQNDCERDWIPAPDRVEGRLCAGMTESSLCCGYPSKGW
jgi:hypothetical protein